MENLGELSTVATTGSLSVNCTQAFSGHLVERGKSERTIQAYCQDVRLFAAWYERENGQAFAPELTTSFDLRSYRSHALDVERVAAATWNRRRISLRIFCAWLVESGTLNYDPFRGIEAVRIEDPGIRALDKPERNKFLRQVELTVNGAVSDFGKWLALRDQAMIALMIHAGLREGEVTALDVADVEIRSRSGEANVRRGKGDKFRQVPLGLEARRAVQMWLDQRPQAEGPLFVGKSGGRLSTRQVQRVVAEIGRMAGQEVTPHDLRHTFASQLINEEKAPLGVAQQILGHKRQDTTARYAKPSWGYLQEAVERI